MSVVQLLQLGLAVACRLPTVVRMGAALIWPLFPGILTPVNHVIFWLIILVPIYFTKNPMSSDDKDPTKKNFGKTFGYAYLIYHVIFVVIYAILFATACKING